MKKKHTQTNKYFFVLLLTVIIFVMGIVVGNFTTREKFDTVVDLAQDIQLQTLGVEIEYDILKESICENENILYLSESLFDLSEKIDFMENNVGSEDQRLEDLKELYFIVEAKHWLLSKQRVEDCMNNTVSVNDSIILYFYSNEGDCSDCEEQGFALSYLQRNNRGIKIYSFDTNSDSSVVNVIKSIYTIGSSTPTLVINDAVHQGYLNANELRAFIANQTATAQIENVNTTAVNVTTNETAAGSLPRQNASLQG